MEADETHVSLPTADGGETLIPTPPPSAAAAKVGGVSIAERRAAKFGFNAEKISTARFRTASPHASPAARSPRLTIPSGITPTALLDSPMMLPNSLALPSPITGSFPFLPSRHESSILNSAPRDDGDDEGLGSFRFKDFMDEKPFAHGSTSGNKEIEAVDQEMFLDTSMSIEFRTDFPEEASTNYRINPSTDVKVSNNVVLDFKPVDLKMSQVVASDPSASRKTVRGKENVTHDISEANKCDYNNSGAMARTAEDGYNWRKYGQKQVKGSEYPRSYYKCTHPNCQVKKKVERSHDGQITEIIYKGAHNHVKPQTNRRPAPGSAFSFDEMSEVSEGTGACVKVEGGSAWTNLQSGSEVKLGYDGRNDGLEITSSPSILTELSDPTMSTNFGKSTSAIESAETPELSSTIASHDDDEDRATQGSMSVGGDDSEESESKRRKKESSLIETTLTSRAAREPRVVVQIESEVDILDDGYRWRKYGQKVVKGNPNPRSYYKCTSAGCPVRKHVERASHNLKCVITTYEGKHNHQVPAARNGNHMNSGGGANTTPAAANSSQPALTLPRNSVIPKPEVQIPELSAQFNRKTDFINDYLQPGFPANFNDARFGPSSIYQMKFPPLQGTIPYTSFGLNPNRVAPQHAGPLGSSVLPDFPMSLPPNLPPPGNLSLVSFDFNGGKPVAPVQPLISGQQQLQQNDMRFLRPKQEQTEDSIYEACLPLSDNTDAASFSSIPSPSTYNRIMGFPS